MSWLLAHLVGDFILQTDWMASGKKKKSWICAIHVMTYLIPFAVIQISWLPLLLIGVQHFAQDRSGFVRWFMGVTEHKSFAEPPMAPWSVILVDNILHLVWIAVVIELFHYNRNNFLTNLAKTCLDI